MKHLLRKLHLGGSHDDHLDGLRASEVRSLEGGASSSGAVRGVQTDSASFATSSDQRLSAPSAISGWLTSVGRQLPYMTCSHPSNVGSLRPRESISGANNSGSNSERSRSSVVSVGNAALSGAVDSEVDFQSLEEEYQVQLAMAISASNNEQSIDPEILEIEAVKRISLGLSPSTATAQAEVIAYRYWTYSYLGYEDHVVDGFYDVYGITESPMSERMPSLSDLQSLPVIDTITYEVVLVNRATDPDLVDLEQRALTLADGCGASEVGYYNSDLVESLAHLVAGHMGGPVRDDIDMLTVWRTTSWALKSSIQNIVLPLGRLSIGLARHRALLFKVLADRIGISSRLVRGRHYTGVDEGALNIIKGDDDLEYIVDLVGDPGTLIPPEEVGLVHPSETSRERVSVIELDRSPDFGLPFPTSRRSCSISTRSPVPSTKDSQTIEGTSLSRNLRTPSVSSPGIIDQQRKSLTKKVKHVFLGDAPVAAGYCGEWNALDGPHASYASSHSNKVDFCHRHWNFEGLPDPSVLELKHVAQTISTAKEKPQLAPELHEVLPKSAIAAFSNLFADISPTCSSAEGTVNEEEMLKANNTVTSRRKDIGDLVVNGDSQPSPKPTTINLVGEFVDRRLCETSLCAGGLNSSSDVVLQSLQAPVVLDLPGQDAAVQSACSTMVVAAAKAVGSHVNVDAPTAGRAVTTLSVALATLYTAEEDRIDKETLPHYVKIGKGARDGDRTSDGEKRRGHNHGRDRFSMQLPPEMGRPATAGNDYHSESIIDEVAEWEIPWEDMIMGERIGIGSYGEVYRGDWHGSEVAVKKFLDQDLSGDALEEFRSEVRIMRRLRHPNVVLFMGAVTRAPNLSIVTEFLPRGSLYRLIHRPNNQLDERKRLRMALDVAKGMNYLHNCSPLIVHRDLKSPNLLVDKNWVVKVCDFGLSRMKHHTFLSSKSTAGTPEWMAPEVLRNEPSNEKSDVYSFGVILWELATLQQPWEGMNPMQVVGAVGFQHRRLDISEQMDPVVARVIRECWQNDPNMRPSFGQLMNALKPLQRPILAPQPDSLSQSNFTACLLHKQPWQPSEQPARPPSAQQNNNRAFPGRLLLNNRLDSGRAFAFKDIQLAP